MKILSCLFSRCEEFLITGCAVGLMFGASVIVLSFCVATTVALILLIEKVLS